MDKTVILKKLIQISNDCDRFKNTLAAIEGIDIDKYPENYNMLVTDAALRSELIACRMRHLIYQHTDAKKEEYLASAGVIQGIKIEDNSDVLEITLPCLLPKRKKRQSTEFIIDPLYFTLSRYSDNHKMKRFKHCVICFSHMYSKEHSQYYSVRDYDNLELKQILDVIATFIMEDDNGLLIDAFNTTEIGEIDCTKIFVMDKKVFSKWITEREKRIKSISNFG